MPLVGKLPPACVIVLLSIVLLRFPVVVPVLKTIVPSVVLVVDPAIVQFLIVLFDASRMNRIVLVPAVPDTVVLTIESEFPPVFRPSIVTFFAPLKLISGLPAAIAPEIDRAPLGVMVR